MKLSTSTTAYLTTIAFLLIVTKPDGVIAAGRRKSPSQRRRHVIAHQNINSFSTHQDLGITIGFLQEEDIDISTDSYCSINDVDDDRINPCTHQQQEQQQQRNASQLIQPEDIHSLYDQISANTTDDANYSDEMYILEEPSPAPKRATSKNQLRSKPSQASFSKAAPTPSPTTSTEEHSSLRIAMATTSDDDNDEVTTKRPRLKKRRNTKPSVTSSSLSPATLTERKVESSSTPALRNRFSTNSPTTSPTSLVLEDDEFLTNLVSSNNNNQSRRKKLRRAKSSSTIPESKKDPRTRFSTESPTRSPTQSIEHEN